MDHVHHVRHHESPSFADTFTHDSWSGDASPFPDSTTSLESPWILYDDFGTSDATTQRSPSASQDSIPGAAYVGANALGLDITLESSCYASLPFPFPPFHDQFSVHTPSPAHPRQPLPQIITSDLTTMSQGPSNAAGLRSPSELSLAAMGPLYSSSTGTPSPSTPGHGSLPLTPAPLQSSSRPLLAIPTPTGLYSPGSYISGVHSNASSPTKSPQHAPAASPSTSPMTIHHTPALYNVPVQQSPPVETVLDIASRWPGAQYIVPQRWYRPNTQSDRRRYVEEVELEGPIMFYMQHPDSLGISCQDAINSRFSRLYGRDDQMFRDRGPSVSIRINWPGYTPWSRQIPTRDFRSPPGPITRAKLAKNVAKTVQRFLAEKKDKKMEDEAEDKYRVARIDIDDIEIVGLQHVSMGSWQAHLRLRPRT